MLTYSVRTTDTRVKAKPKLFLEFHVPQIGLLNRISCETAIQLCDLTVLDSDLEFILAQGIGIVANHTTIAYHHG